MSTSFMQENACNVFAGWRGEPNDVALSVPPWLRCYMWHVFHLVA